MAVVGDAKVEDGRIKKLFPKQWLEIVNLAQGGMRVAAIAEKYDVSPNAIYAGLKKRKVDLTAVAARVTREENDRARDETLKKIKDTKDKDYKAVVYIQGLALKRLAEVSTKMEPASTCLDDMKAYKIAMETIASGTKAKWTILGLDKANENADAILPELPIRDMTPEEFQAIRKRQAQEDEGMQFDENGDPIIEEAEEEADDDRIAEGCDDDDLAKLDADLKDSV